MNKKKIALTAAALLLVALGITAFSPAYAQTPDGVQAERNSPIQHPHGPREPGPLTDYLKQATADILGLTVEEFEAARQAGTRMPELIEAAGLSVEEFQAAMEAALPEILENAVNDEAINQDQADFILENGLRHGRRRNRLGSGPLNPYVKTAVAETLGLSVEELDAAQEGGLRLPDLLEEAGLTEEEFKTAMQEAWPGILEQGVEAGLITQAQMDFILENGLRNLPKMERLLYPYIQAEIAASLGLSVEDLIEAREAGTKLEALLEEAGLSPEEFRGAMQEAWPEILEDAVNDGLITQDQMDRMLENGWHPHPGRGPGRRPPGGITPARGEGSDQG